MEHRERETEQTAKRVTDRMVRYMCNCPPQCVAVPV